MNVSFKGHLLECKVVRSNLRLEVAKHYHLNSEAEVTDSLVKYDPYTNTITVDEQADDFYVRNAVIHECICCGRYDYLAPLVQNLEERCGNIDKMLTKSMTETEKRKYVSKRIEMYETLIKLGLNPGMNSVFEKSLEILKAL